MRGKGIRKVSARACICTGLLMCASMATFGQTRVQVVSADPQPSETPAEVRELAGLIRELQDQVHDLNSQVTELRASQERTQTEALELRRELELARSPVTATAAVGVTTTGPALQADTTPATSQGATIARIVPPQEQTPAERIAGLEDDLQVIDAKVTDQAQTKVESGSKYRLRVSGLVLLNVFDSRGAVDNLDNPELAEEPNAFGSPSAFGGSVRQSQIKLETFGPDIAGARTSANVQFDFAGGFASVWNGAATSFMRLRTGTMRMDWTNTSIVAGQDSLFFAPLSPTSIASLSAPPLGYAGNLWGWTPQVRIEHRVTLSDTSSLRIQGGILDDLTGDVPQSNFYRTPSWGEMSGQPAYATRIAFSQRVFGQNLTVAAGGYYGRQFWGLNRTFDAWAGTTDLSMPLGKFFAFSGAFYRGRGAGGLGGAIGQTVIFNGSFTSPTTLFRGLDSEGGWAQLKFMPRPKLEINGAYGIDSPFAGEMRDTNANLIYTDAYTRNVNFFVNFIYQIRSDVLFSTEYRRLQTTILDSGFNTANQSTLSLGYLF
jgi:hypothetical protein